MWIEPEDACKKVMVDGVAGAGAGLKVFKHLNLPGQARFDYGFGDVE